MGFSTQAPAGLIRKAAVAALTLLVVAAGAVTAAGCGAAAGVEPTGSATAATSPYPTPADADLIAFQAGSIGGPDNTVVWDGIWVVRPDGTGLKQLTEGGSQPAWSPDGGRIGYAVAMDGLYVMRADGSDQRKVADVTPSCGISWSPDGTRIAFSGPSERTDAALFVIGVDGAGLEQITEPGDPGSRDERPAWAPDGRIYFTRVVPPPIEESLDGESAVGAAGWIARSLCSVESDGGGLKVLQSSLADLGASFSSDGRRMALLEADVDRIVTRAADGDGKKLVAVDHVSQYAPPRAFFGAAFSLSGDGRRLVFAGRGGPYLAPCGLYVVNADGSGLKRVPHAGMGFDPVWRPQQAAADAVPVPAVSYADPPYPNDSGAGRPFGIGAVGWRFKPNVDIDVTDLGCYDADQDGLTGAHRVGIFDAATDRLVASIKVLPDSPLEGAFRWRSLASPVGLKAGHSYLVASECVEGDALYDELPGFGPAWASEIDYGRLFWAAGTFKAPHEDNPWLCFWGPNFKFTPAAPAE